MKEKGKFLLLFCMLIVLCIVATMNCGGDDNSETNNTTTHENGDGDTTVDSDQDGVPDESDCAPDDPNRWAWIEMCPDADGDMLPESGQSTRQCVGADESTWPEGWTPICSPLDPCPDDPDNLCEAATGFKVTVCYDSTVTGYLALSHYDPIAENAWISIWDTPLAGGCATTYTRGYPFFGTVDATVQAIGDGEPGDVEWYADTVAPLYVTVDDTFTYTYTTDDYIAPNPDTGQCELGCGYPVCFVPDPDLCPFLNDGDDGDGEVEVEIILDYDGDTVPDGPQNGGPDNCHLFTNTQQTDADNNGIGDRCEDTTYQENQRDSDNDWVTDNLDPDDDDPNIP